jgi:hypothetical protein
MKNIRISKCVFEDFLCEIGWMERLTFGCYWATIPEFVPMRDCDYEFRFRFSMAKQSIRIHKMLRELANEN